MQIKERKICSLTQKGTSLQLLEIIILDGMNSRSKYQVRLNRKRISTSISEYNERKVFATYAQNIVLQLKIY